MPLVARLERQVPYLRVDDVVAKQGPHPPLDYEAVLVLTGVLVDRGGQAAWGHRMLDEREAPTRLLGTSHHPSADRSQVDCLAVVGPNDSRALGGIESLQVSHLRARFHMCLLSE